MHTDAKSEISFAEALRSKFLEKFGMTGRIFRAPGRVNLIGEHTDYNEGFVFPAAINFSCWVAIAPRADRKLVMYSENFAETTEVDLDDPKLKRRGTWSDYPAGVAAILCKSGKHIRGANAYIVGEVPLGAGLSSSAAIEVAIGYALLEISGETVERTELARECQRAENEFVGARCGIMDQFASCHGRAGHALLLDCRSLAYRLVAIPSNLEFVVCNTMVKHELASNEYNVRRQQCEESVRRLSAALPKIRALRDVAPEQLEEHRGLLSDVLWRRSRHIVSENERVEKAAAALESNDAPALRDLMAESHRSLRDDFEVSSPDLDLMVELASRQRGVRGARMTGGGFGGCTVNLVDHEATPEFCQNVRTAYEEQTRIVPDIYICKASGGVGAMLNGDEKAAHEIV